MFPQHFPVNLDDFKYGGTNFSAYRMIDVDKPEVENEFTQLGSR